MGHRVPVRAKLVEFWMNNPRKPVNVDKIAEAIGMTREQVQVGMNNMMSNNVLPGIRRIVAGHTWSYEPESVPERPAESTRTQTPASTPRRRRGAPRTFEEVGETRDGALIIKGSNGALYRAEEL